MRMIPSGVSAGTQSRAERRLFDLLRDVNPVPDAFCLHSLNISEHDYKLCGELDFVVVSPSGVLVLEVKGGGVSCHDGIWTFRDRMNREHRTSEGPFKQARSGMFSLRARLEEQFGSGLLRRLPFGYGVALPDCEFELQSVEWSREMVLDAPVFRTRPALKDSLCRLLEYWVAKRDFWEAPDPDLAGRVVQYLRPDFDKAPSLQVRAEEIDRVMERLTEEQYVQLDVIEDNPRILCTGGAGTGKTFLACEIARRLAGEGREVLVTCQSPILAAFIGSRLSAKGVTVCDFGQLRVRDYVFTALIVDEAQDVMNFEALERLDGVLEGGLEHGCWRLFYDPNKQTGLHSTFEPEAVALLRSYGAVAAKLQRNCRNTTDIVLQTKLWSGADPGTAHAGKGPPVEYVYYRDRAEEVMLIERELSRLYEAGVSPGDVTLLTPYELSQSSIILLKAYRAGKIKPLTTALAASWPVLETSAASVTDFKGLENRFVLAVDLESSDSLSLLENKLYVAMTRARTGLWMAVSRGLEPLVMELHSRNLKLAMQSAKPKGSNVQA